MIYQIACVCGHKFQRSDDELKGSISCPACARPLSVVIQAPVTAAAAVASAVPDAPAPASTDTTVAPVGDGTAPEPTKRCPFCGEVILAIARKCKHCGEFLDRGDPAAPATHSAATTTAPAATLPPSSDEPVFSLTTSQWDNFWRFLILATCVLFMAFITLFFTALRPYAAVAILGTAVFAGFFAWFFYLHARNTRTYIRPTRIDVEKGILSRSLDSLELFRISDTELKQGFLERILGIGSIKLTTSDSDGPNMVLYQIPRAREVLKYLQTQIPIAAKQRGAVFMDK